MAKVFTFKNLANGQLATTLANIYLVATATASIIKTVSIVNTNTTTETVNLYILKSAGTARRIIPKDIMLDADFLLETDGTYTLGAGDSVQGNTTTASKVDYTISGTEET